MTSILSDTWFMIGRQTRNLLRQPIWIALILIQPMIWLLLYGQLFKRAVALPGFGDATYIAFLTPGIVVMNAFFGAMWSGMAMIQDIDRRVIERFLATPATRLSLVLSQIVRTSLIAAVQAVILLLVSLALGVRVHEGAAGWAILILASMLVASAFGGISHGLALLMRREESMIGVANFVGLPLLFVSSTLLAAASIPHWMRWAMRFNPVNWGVQAAREPVLAGTDWGSIGFHLALLAALTVATAAFATWAFRAYQRTL
jgi:ABC-2 type transport system permease protein